MQLPNPNDSDALAIDGTQCAFLRNVKNCLPPFAVVGAAFLFHGSAAFGGAVDGTVELRNAKHVALPNQRYGGADSAVVAPDPAAAVVYLEGDFPLPKSPPHAQMAQRNLAFSTSLLPVLIGTTVEFPNDDDTYHNIFSYSKPKRFDLGRYRKDERPIPTQTFDKPGVVALHCDIHEHMQSVILVLTTPYFARTDGRGKYHLDGLPAGQYVLKAWVDSRTTYEHPVELKRDETLHIDFP